MGALVELALLAATVAGAGLIGSITGERAARRLANELRESEDEQRKLENRVELCEMGKDGQWRAQTADGHSFIQRRAAKDDPLTWWSEDEGWQVTEYSPLADPLREARNAAIIGGENKWVRHTLRKGR